MSVQHRSLFGPSFDNNQPGVNQTGATEPMDSRDALSSELSRGRGYEDAYRASQAAASGVTDGGATGLELEHGDEAEDAELVTGEDPREKEVTGSLPTDSNLQSTTTISVAGDDLVRSTGAGDVERDTGQSGGRAIG